MQKARLTLKDGSSYEGISFGASRSMAGEVVFATGMVGYPEALTDPSFAGQILVLTYPLVGNYGVPDEKFWESEKIQVAGLVVSNYIDTPSHWQSKMTLAKWFQSENLPLLEIKDTRGLTQKLRSQGVMLGKIETGKKINFEDPNKRNLVAEVSRREVTQAGAGKTTVILVDCGAKRNIERRLEERGLRVVTVPWDTDLEKLDFSYKAVVISNGPGDPKMARRTVANVKKIMGKVPILGICLGNQILALAAGGSTYKLKFGHRSQNQPVVLSGSKKCYLTTQNHGFAVGKIPRSFREWFRNANDGTNEGVIHERLPIMSVQFHPESSPGPLDTDWIFDYFLKRAKIQKK
ncbi:MAG: glutamine-hydrolyzing carbamoyl-phosphate synthase small subunit [Patescibacteria group bacterium]